MEDLPNCVVDNLSFQLSQGTFLFTHQPTCKSSMILASHKILFSFLLNPQRTTFLKCIVQPWTCSLLPMNYSIHPKVKSNHMNKNNSPRISVYLLVREKYVCNPNFLLLNLFPNVLFNFAKCSAKILLNFQSPLPMNDSIQPKIKTLPEAQRIQGIDSLTKIIFLTEINLKVY